MIVCLVWRRTVNGKEASINAAGSFTMYFRAFTFCIIFSTICIMRRKELL
jgi:hypothetical protein